MKNINKSNFSIKNIEMSNLSEVTSQQQVSVVGGGFVAAGAGAAAGYGAATYFIPDNNPIKPVAQGLAIGIGGSLGFLVPSP